MKASVKFREDQKPLMRAKVPLSILGLPFQSTIAAGTSKDLTLSLSTLFDSGPSFNLSYRPNDSSNPFSLIVKTGIGHFGSPICSSMLISAQFNLIAAGNPSFMLHFKPKLGDFSFKKSHTSSAIFQNLLKSDGQGSADVSNAFSGFHVATTTAVPVLRCAALRFCWGLRVPTTAAEFREAPFMVLDKIGIEHVDGRDSNSKEGSLGNGDLELGCFGVKRQFEVLERENGLMKKGIEDLTKQMKLFSNYGDFGLPAEEAAAAALFGG